MKSLLLPFVVSILSFVESHPDILKCQDVRKDNDIMGAPPELDENLVVTFLKNGEPLDCGGFYFSNDTLAVVNNLESGVSETLLDMIGATFDIDPHCQGTEMHGINTNIPSIAPITVVANTVSVYGARAFEEFTVFYSQTCLITQDPSDPNILGDAVPFDGVGFTVGAFLGVAVGILFAVGGILLMAKVIRKRRLLQEDEKNVLEQSL